MTEEKKSKIIEGEVLEETPEAPKTRQFVSEKMVGTLVLVVALIIGGYYAYDPVRAWLAKFEEPTPQPQEVAETDEISVLKERLRALENQPAPVESPDLEERFKKIDEALSTLKQTPNDRGETEARPDPRIEMLIEEVNALKAELEKRPAQKPGPGATFAKALAALAPPLYQSLPFEGELEQIRILALEMPALSQATLSEPLSVLSGFSKTGVPSLMDLKKAFARASIEALKVEGLSSDAGWWAKTWSRIKGLVVVRRTDGAGGTPLDMTLYAAEKNLEEGNVKAAMELISALPSGEGAAFGPWLEKAAMREKALDAFADLINFIPQTPPSGENN